MGVSGGLPWRTWKFCRSGCIRAAHLDQGSWWGRYSVGCPRRRPRAEPCVVISPVAPSRREPPRDAASNKRWKPSAVKSSSLFDGGGGVHTRVDISRFTPEISMSDTGLAASLGAESGLLHPRLAKARGGPCCGGFVVLLCVGVASASSGSCSGSASCAPRRVSDAYEPSPYCTLGMWPRMGKGLLIRGSTSEATPLDGCQEGWCETGFGLVCHSRWCIYDFG